ncbi:MAG: DUF192 domain-containing protein [Rhodocyclaceae bacterium]|nr:DUF192 domain-containing protein [Rhodocyclaceae bacterium]
MKKRLLVLLWAMAAGAWGQALPTVELAAGIHRIEAEVAATPPQRMAGLMHRRSLPPQRGMLFAFPDDAQHCMWMKNTLIPLAVAFLDAEGRIINIAEMQPETLDNHCAARPARFALEMNAGWFKSRGLKAGDKISGLERVPPGR